MKTLYIIGNGFDIAHKLDTSYWDFRVYLARTYPEFLQEFEHMYNIEQFDPSSPRVSAGADKQWEKAVRNELWSEFENKMGYPNISEMIDISTSVLDNMDLDSGLVGIEDTMDSYWADQYGYIKELELHVKEWIETVNTNGKTPMRKSLIGSTDYFLTFNYTDLLENIYKIKNVLHIHGGVASVTNTSPIMGHCNHKDIEDHQRLANEADEEFDEGNASIHRAVANYLEFTYKDTASIIRQYHECWKELHNVDKVVIFGWSAGAADLPYLCVIRDFVSKNTKWYAYYHDDTAYNSLNNAMSNEGIEEKYEVNYIPAVEFWDQI